MNWILSSELTVEETNTGFVIYLSSGSWLEPLAVETKNIDTMTIHDQAKYLRLGLIFAEKLMIEILTH
jgi:hypothetical protein